MEFRLLGPFEAWHNGVQVDLGELQQRHVLAVLLLHANKPVSGDRLADIIWGEHRPKSNLIVGYIAKIRRAFQAAHANDVKIATTPTGYRLEIDEGKLDSVRFTTLCAKAATAGRDGDPASANRLLHEAVALWRGRYLEDLDIDRIGGTALMSPDEALIDALSDLAELELAAGNHRWVRDRLWPFVQADPGRQRLAVPLIRALLAGGDRIQAMEVYDRATKALEDHDVAVSADLRRLSRQARYGTPRGSLPPPSRRFTGRTKELAEIESLAASGVGPVLVWLSGMPGVGKTTLAVEAAHRLLTRFTDARLFVELNGFTPNVEPTTPVGALGALLDSLGVPVEQVPSTLQGRLARYRDELADTRTIVVLDNASSEDQVRALLPESPTCMAIVTSRKVGDIEVTDNLRLEPMSEQEAVDLFRALVGRKRLPEPATLVKEVVARCGRIPMQIKVVASQFRRHDRWPVQYLLELLDKARPWARNDGFDDDGIVACTVSYQQLEQRQRALFRLFGHFPGHDIDPRGAAALAGCDLGQARSLLEQLYGLCLLVETSPHRYRMLDPVKNFAATLAQETPLEHHEGLTRLLDFYLVSTATAVATAFPFDWEPQSGVDTNSPVAPALRDQKEAMAWLAAEWPNLVASIRHAAGHGRPEHAWRLAVLLWRYFHTTGRLHDWIETLELARRITKADPQNRYGHAQVLLRLSTARWRSGELDTALELAGEALSRLVEIGDVRGEADALCGIALVAIDRGAHRQAMARFETALAKYEETGHQRGQAHALSHLGHLNEMHGEFALAETQHLAAISLLESIDHRAGLANAMDNLGSVRQRLGRLDQALADHEKARLLAVDVGDHTAEAYALNNLGNAYRRLARLDEAVRHHESAAVANPEPDPTLRIQLLSDLGATRLAGRDPHGARREYREALTLASRIGDRRQQAKANLGLAKALHSLGEHRQAAGHWRVAEAQLEELGLPEVTAIHAELRSLDCACVTG